MKNRLFLAGGSLAGFCCYAVYLLSSAFLTFLLPRPADRGGVVRPDAPAVTVVNCACRERPATRTLNVEILDLKVRDTHVLEFGRIAYKVSGGDEGAHQKGEAPDQRHDLRPRRRNPDRGRRRRGRRVTRSKPDRSRASSSGDLKNGRRQVEARASTSRSATRARLRGSRR